MIASQSRIHLGLKHFGLIHCGKAVQGRGGACPPNGPPGGPPGMGPQGVCPVKGRGGACRFRLPTSRSGSFRLRLAALSTAVSSAVSIRKCFALAGTWLKYEAVTHKFQLWLFEPHFEIFGQTRAKSCSLLWFMFKSKSTKCGDIKDCYSTSV